MEAAQIVLIEKQEWLRSGDAPKRGQASAWPEDNLHP
jgi:hypothetical protein